jgi:hypothetical protein
VLIDEQPGETCDVAELKRQIQPGIDSLHRYEVE